MLLYPPKDFVTLKFLQSFIVYILTNYQWIVNE